MAEKAQLRGEVDKIEQEVSMAIASAEDHSCECENLRDEVDNMNDQNCELEDKLEEYEERCQLREQRIALLEEKEAKYNDVMTILRNQLHDANVKLELKEHDNMSLKSQKGTKVNNHCCNQMCKSNDQEERDWKRREERPVCTADSPEGNPKQRSSLFTPECPPLKVPSHITISLTISLLFLQPPVGYHKGLSADLECNWGNASDRMEELKRVMGGRDTRGTNALENAKLNRGDDPIIFCSEYLTLYRSTYNCPDMSPDDNSFLYSMANKCTFVDYPTKLASRNANSYQAFVNILKDWIQDTSHDNKPQRRISEIVKNEGKVRFVGKCYRCGYTGHTMKECRSRKRIINNRPFIDRKQTQEQEPNASNGEHSLPEVTLYGPLLEELRKIGKAMAGKPEELKIPPKTIGMSGPSVVPSESA
ncbi:posterior protein-like [Ranitomeya imitator]|uniref:posterior protein-like n=1 Tax=Ranitomeya imitator TaxID=111125 RepID=UPI0037E7356B